MNLARLALIIAVTCGGASAHAVQLDVASIQSQIQSRQTELESYQSSLQTYLDESRSMQEQLSSLRQQSKALDKKKTIALDEMNAQYQRMIDNPSLDISEDRKAYVDAVNAHKQNKEDIINQLSAIQTKKEEIEQVRLSIHTLLNTLEGMRERLNSARVERIYREFNQDGNLAISNKVSCDLDETIARCSQRAKQLTKQKASKRFLDKIYHQLTEAKVAEDYRATTDANVVILGSTINDSGFSGQADYFVKMNVNMRGNLNKHQACSLLNLDARYCISFDKPEKTALKADDKQLDDSVMFELTVRSNVYDDEVFIDGVSYGSTKLAVMLPAGPHTVKVSKLGYEPYFEELILKEGSTIKAELSKSSQKFSTGEKILDYLSNDKPGPQLVVIPAGGFQFGDIAGRGLDNERPVVSYQIENSFGVSENEITVEQFDEFVHATSYVSDAEQGKGCAYYDSGKPVWDQTLNWREPGFKQQPSHPVVCISLSDAQRYTDWLSSETGKNYRLPTEAEWEYAARGNQESDYWWGESIGTNKANCGWCGTQWSNKGSSPVASFKRNQFGLYDTVGNVWEWTLSESENSEGVVRGGAYNFAPRLARVSTRIPLASDFRSNYIGFRVVRER
ncbi:formylglycine-generating enzyme family protein [Flocculibacter collagenilyticus]|uniref:formylglycine-generating enzyme family protein n=1 Tax=Flocculibacter collagenilyticus TaxID=2744479 RepID=UPI0018F3499A|nr:formylglycine-generating enzyme family protein [Flocculibacter collagenilyticus]